MQLKAKHLIHRRNRGVLEEIRPGKIFRALNERERDRLTAMGAAAPYSGPQPAGPEPAEQIPVSVSAPISEPVVEPEEPTGPSEPDLEAMTKVQLIEFAEQHGIDVDASAKKADIIDAIRDAQAGDDLV